VIVLALSDRSFNSIYIHSDRLFAMVRTYQKYKTAGPHASTARASSHRSIEQKSIPRNAIADGANSAATRASAQGNQLSIANKETATPSNGARADSLACE
jgi:hypothetical protein